LRALGFAFISRHAFAADTECIGIPRRECRDTTALSIPNARAISEMLISQVNGSSN
jgi:hypothetical protein